MGAKAPLDHLLQQFVGSSVVLKTWRDTMAVLNYERVQNLSRCNNSSASITLVRKPCTVVNLILHCAYTNKCKMNYDIRWIIPKLRQPTRLWHFASSLTFAAVGIFSKIIIRE